MQKATAYSCASVSAPNQNAIGKLRSAAARPRSAAIIWRRRWPRRSSHAPAYRENSKLGTRPAVIRYPISVALACSTSTPTSGRASSEIWSPNSEMVSAIQNRRKLRSWRRSGSRCGTVFSLRARADHLVRDSRGTVQRCGVPSRSGPLWRVPLIGFAGAVLLGSGLCMKRLPRSRFDARSRDDRVRYAHSSPTILARRFECSRCEISRPADPSGFFTRS